MNEGEVDILVATIQLIGEGFDLSGAVSPVHGHAGKIFRQGASGCPDAVLRAQKGKGRAAVFDYVDKPGVLQASFHSRMESPIASWACRGKPPCDSAHNTLAKRLADRDNPCVGSNGFFMV